MDIPIYKNGIVVTKSTVDDRTGSYGSSYHKLSGKWEATLTKNSKKIFLGLFPTARVARNAYKFAKSVIANDKYNGRGQQAKRYADKVLRLRGRV